MSHDQRACHAPPAGAPDAISATGSDAIRAATEGADAISAVTDAGRDQRRYLPLADAIRAATDRDRVFSQLGADYSRCGARLDMPLVRAGRLAARA